MESAYYPNTVVLNQEPKKKKHKGIIISVISVVLIIVGLLGFGILRKGKELKYYSDMATVSSTMLDGAIKAETAGNLVKKVWYNVIYEERDTETDKYTMKKGKFADDFNDALSALFDDESFVNSISEIQSNQAEVTALMKKLRNPPTRYREAYSELKNYYDNYLQLTNAVINPTGSLNTFSENFKTYDTNTANAYEKMLFYFN